MEISSIIIASSLTIAVIILIVKQSNYEKRIEKKKKEFEELLLKANFTIDTLRFINAGKDGTIVNNMLTHIMQDALVRERVVNRILAIAVDAGDSIGITQRLTKIQLEEMKKMRDEINWLSNQVRLTKDYIIAMQRHRRSW